jgi:hypothetical protein
MLLRVEQVSASVVCDEINSPSFPSKLSGKLDKIHFICSQHSFNRGFLTWYAGYLRGVLSSRNQLTLGKAILLTANGRTGTHNKVGLGNMARRGRGFFESNDRSHTVSADGDELTQKQEQPQKNQETPNSNSIFSLNHLISQYSGTMLPLVLPLILVVLPTLIFKCLCGSSPTITYDGNAAISKTELQHVLPPDCSLRHQHSHQHQQHYQGKYQAGRYQQQYQQQQQQQQQQNFHHESSQRIQRARSTVNAHADLHQRMSSPVVSPPLGMQSAPIMSSFNALE